MKKEINTIYDKKEKLDLIEYKIDKKNYINNIVDNFFFIISSISFVLVTILSTEKIIFSYALTIISTEIVALIYAAYNNNLMRNFLEKKILNKVISTISTLTLNIFYLNRLKQNIPSKIFNIEVIGNNKNIICAILIFVAIPFCIEMFSKIYSFLFDFIKYIWRKSNKINKNIFIISNMILFLIVLVAFLRVDALHRFSSNIRYDVIYTSDNLELLRNNAWLNINHPENDIRQPLFAVFSIPIVAPFYIFEAIFNLSFPISVIFSNMIIIVASAYMLADLVEKENNKMIFYIFYLSTYGPLLFLFMLEQYSVSFFWMIILLYMYINKIENRKVFMVGATGSLITTGIMFPLLYNKEDRRCEKIKKVFLAILLGLFIFLLFGKINIILTLKERLEFLLTFAGNKLVFLDKFKQYTHFITNCFVSINAIGINDLWKLKFIDTVNVEGIIILILAVISFVVNRKDKLSRISFYWIIFSFIILCVIGWGTIENGLILYSLYFSWALIILMFNLTKKVFNIINKEKSFYMFIIILSLILFVYNGYSIIKMLMYLSKIVL